MTGRSARVGHPPEWLKFAWDFRALGFSARGEDTILTIAAPTLGDAAPRFFEQQTLWETAVKPSETALDLLGKLIRDVRAHASGSDAYDDPLLKQISEWGSLFRAKVKSVGIPNRMANSADTELDSSVVLAADELSSRIPPPRPIRLVGTVDMVRWSTRSMAIRAEDGTEYRCAVVNDDLEDVGRYGGRDVTVLGKAIYRPSGAVLRLDIQQVLDTTAGRAAFSQVPSSFERQDRTDRKPQTSKSGVSAIFGTWQGRETDQELLTALAGLRG